MQRIAKFEKVSKEQWLKDCDRDDAAEIYESIKLPKRATTGSAGYDFYSPFSFELKPGETIKIPTGIRAKMDEGWVMFGVPRSSAGIKKGIKLQNTICIGDEDYYGAKNEGHYFMALKNDSDKTVSFERDERFVQVVFVPFGITVDDDAEDIRTGGIGSTNK